MTSLSADRTTVSEQHGAPPGGAEDYDLIVIGAGSAGIAATATGRRAGARTLLIERGRPGGTCLWTGTLPSKALLAAARTAHLMRTADRFGIRPVEPEINFGDLMRNIEARIGAVASESSTERLSDLGVELVTGSAAFTGPETVSVGEREYRFGHAVIATGSAPAMPAVPRLAECAPLTTDTLWELRFLPETLTVLGGGPNGCELGQAMARLGARVTIIEQQERLLPQYEPEASELIAARLEQEGVRVLTSTTVRAARSFTGHNQLMISGPDGEQTIEAGRILIAAGRRPVTAGLDLAKAGVRVNESGWIATDERLRTSNRRIFAAGDAGGDAPLDGLAELDGEIAAHNAVIGRAIPARHELASRVVFTDPEVALVGSTEAAARAVHGDRIGVRYGPTGRLDRAVADQESPGLTKIISDERGRLLGATVVSPRAGEVIAEVATVLQQRGRIGDLAGLPHAYPTWSAAIWNAALVDQAEREPGRASRLGAVLRR